MSLLADLPMGLPAPAALVHPGLLVLGAALAAIPIVIHLLNRRRVQRVRWAAMQWLLAAMRRHQRRLRLENWLVLLLRVAAILLLGLALARPILEDTGFASSVLGARRSVYVLVDNSYSTMAKVRARSVADAIKAEVDAVLAGLGPEDTVAVVATNDPRTPLADPRSPFVLVARGVGQEAVARAREAVAGLRTRDAPAAWRRAVDLIEEQTTPEDVNRLFVVVTDFQARDWTASRLAGRVEDEGRDQPPTEGRGAGSGDAGAGVADARGADAGGATSPGVSGPEARHELAERLGRLVRRAPLRVVDAGGQDRRNLVVARVASALQQDAFVGRPLRVSASIENHGPTPVVGARASLSLDGDATPLQRVVVPPLDAVDAGTGMPGRQVVVLDLPASALEVPGSHVVHVEVRPPPDDPGADALGLDSRRSLALRVRDRIRVLAWTQSSERAAQQADTYLRALYEPRDQDPEGAGPVRRKPVYEMRSVASENALVEALRPTGRAPADLVVLANVVPRGPAIEALQSHVRGGGALLVFVGDRIQDPAALNGPFHDDPRTRLLPFPLDAPEVPHVPEPHVPDKAPFQIDLLRGTGHPLAEHFTGEHAATWIRQVPTAIWGRIPFGERALPPGPADGGSAPEGTLADQGQVVLRFTDGRPAVVEGRLGMGRTLWVATSVDHGWFERSVPFFLPVLLDEGARYLTRPDEARRNLLVGGSIVASLARDAQEAVFAVPGGGQVTPNRYDGLTEADRPWVSVEHAGLAGVWRLSWRAAAGAPEAVRAEEHFVANPEPGEGALQRASDLAFLGRLPPGTDAQVLSSWEEAAAHAGEAREGEISGPLLWIALAILLLESLLAWAFGRRRDVSAGQTGAPGVPQAPA